MNKILLFIVLFVIVCMPVAAVSPFGPSDVQFSPFTKQLSWEEFFLYGGILPTDISVQDGKPCIKPAAKPDLRAPDPVDNYLVPLNELQLPQYGFEQDIAYLKAKQARMKEIIRMTTEAYNDPAVQDYMIFADNPIMYQNTDYGLLFGTVADSLAFGQEALQLIGKVTDSAYEGAMWVNYGYLTNSAMPGIALKEYAEFNMLFNGLMEQIQSNSELENAVDYAADVLGSQMQQQVQAGNNIFQAHEQLNIAGDSMQRADDFFHAGDIAAAAGKNGLAQKMDFMGMMNVAEAFYSIGESYKLKQAVLFMLLEGVFKNKQKLQRKLGTFLGPPCDPIPAVCPVPPGEPPFSVMMHCCEGCPPAMYILTSSVSPCVASGQGQPPGPGVPGHTPLPGGTPAPSALPGTGGAIAAPEEADDFPHPIYKFNKNNIPDLKAWYSRIPSYPAVPSVITPDPKIVVQENTKSVSTAREAFVMAADKDLKIQPAQVVYNEKPVIITEKENRVVLEDDNGNPVTAINTITPEAVAVELKNNPENFASELAVDGLDIIQEQIMYNGESVTVNSQTGELVNKDGSVVQDLGVEFAHDFVMYDIAEERLNNLNKVLAVEYNKQPIYEKDRQTYLEQKTEDLILQLDAIDRQYKFEITNIRADPDLSFEQRNDMITTLYDRTNKDLRKAVESTITDEGVRRFTYLIPEEEEALLELIGQRSRTDDYAGITDINSRILAIVYPDAGIDTYYEYLRAQNMPMSNK